MPKRFAVRDSVCLNCFYEYKKARLPFVKTFWVPRVYSSWLHEDASIIWDKRTVRARLAKTLLLFAKQLTCCIRSKITTYICNIIPDLQIPIQVKQRKLPKFGGTEPGIHDVTKRYRWKPSVRVLCLGKYPYWDDRSNWLPSVVPHVADFLPAQGRNGFTNSVRSKMTRL